MHNLTHAEAVATELAGELELEPVRQRPPAVRPAAEQDYRPRYIDACLSRRWSIYLAKGGRRWAVPYACRSWRHEGPCRAWRSAENYARLAGPLERVDPSHVLLLVLTFDQTAMARGLACVELGCALRGLAGLEVTPAMRAPGDPRWVAFVSLWRRWQSLRKAMHREADRDHETRMRWALTCEVHKSGWPHANVLIHSEWLAGRLAADRHDCVRARLAGVRCGRPSCVRDWLAEHATACGFGPVLSLDVARDAKQAAGYILKLAGELESGVQVAARRRRRKRAAELGQAIGEVVKFSQVPTNAPPRFRRIRASMKSASRGLAAMMDPPRAPDPEIRGRLCGCDVATVAAAIARDIDLVEQVDDQTGEVSIVSFLAARGPPGYTSAEWRLLIALKRERRSPEFRKWVADVCPELAE